MSKVVKKKRICLPIDLKAKILKEVDAKLLSKSAIAKKYGIPNSTLSTIIKDRQKVENSHNAGVAPSRKYSREAKYPQLEKVLLAWLKKMRGKNVPVDGNILKEQAEVFALRLNLTDFKGSVGWLQKFKLRHGLVFRKVCGESGDVDISQTNEWKENHLKSLLSEYSAEDIFNADETGLFYKLLPDRALVFKGETCSGGKRAKQRITIMMAANMTGTEKLPLLVIGKFRKPRCFKNIRSLPTQWEANRKAWMTAEIYTKWIKDLDRQLSQKKRKILLVVDNCTAHVSIDGLQAVRIEYLPPNVTSVLQPLDQGVIQCFKKHYRRMLLRRVILNMENDKEYEVDVLGALHLAVRAWNEVKPATIANCFRHAGFIKENSVADEEVGAEESEIEDTAEDDLLLNTLKSKNARVPKDVTFTEFSNVDSNVYCIDEVSDEEIIKQTLEPEEQDLSDEEEDAGSDFRPTSKEAAEALSVLRRFFETGDSCIPEMKSIDALEKSVFKSVVLKQSKITGFFSS